MMKETLSITLGLAVAGLVALYAVQARKTASQKAQLASAQVELEKKTQAAAAAQAAQQESERERNELLRAATAPSRQQSSNRTERMASVAASRAGAAQASGGDTGSEGGLGQLLAKMLNDPDTRKFIREQQRMMMDQMYAPLIKQMGLTPEEGERFKDLVADNAMKATEKAGSLFGGVATNRTAAFGQMAEEQKGLEQQVKAFLGDTRYAQYQDYQQTVGDRVQLNLFRQQSGGGPNALTDVQAEQLLGIMREEKQAVASRTGQSFPGADQSQNLQAMLSEEQANRLFDAQETVNQRVYERAGQILSSDQLAGFARFQTNQMQTLRLGVSMARKMMGGGQ